MEDPLALRREMEGRSPRPDSQKPKRQKPKRQRQQRGAHGPQQPARTKQPRASERASVAAQDWYDRGTALGFSFPYDVNYFALALQRKIEHDPKISPFITDGDKADRWVAKMVANWWDHYVDETITASNAKEMFLGNDWEDVRDWAHSNLRKDYLLKHGKRVAPPVYLHQQDYQQRLEDVHKKAQVDRYIASQPEVGDPPELDPEARGRLRSFANRRRRKK